MSLKSQQTYSDGREGEGVETGIVLHQVCLHAFLLASGALSGGIFGAVHGDV